MPQGGKACAPSEPPPNPCEVQAKKRMACCANEPKPEPRCRNGKGGGGTDTSWGPGFSFAPEPLCHSANIRRSVKHNTRMKGLGKRISTSTLHGIESVNDLRSWSTCREDRRKHFLERMFSLENDPLEGQLEQDERADQDSEEYGLDESSNKGRSPRNSNKPQDEGVLEKGENELPVEYGNEEFYQESFDEQMNDDYNTISPSSGGRRSGGPKKTKGRLMSNDDSSDTPFNGLVIETDLDLGNRGGSSPELNKSNSRSRSRSARTSRRAIEGSGPSKIPGPSRRRSADDSEAGTDRTRSSDGFRPGDDLDEGGNRSWESNNEDENADGDEAADVVTYNVTTVSDYEVYGDNAKYMGSKILPTDDPNPDDQNSRLEGTDAVVEKLKTQLDQLQRALEAEKQRSQELANQLNEIFQDAPHNMPGDSQADRSSRFGPGEESRMEEQIRELEHTLQEKNRSECKYKRNLDCVYAALGQLQDENQQLRSYVQELENDLQYSSQVQP